MKLLTVGWLALLAGWVFVAVASLAYILQVAKPLLLLLAALPLFLFGTATGIYLNARKR